VFERGVRLGDWQLKARSAGAARRVLLGRGSLVVGVRDAD
jgi:hypothetical protein